jgi:predicted HD phosphohydrolase
LIAALDDDDRWRAAGIVFEIGHPVADMGDDRSAGPIMELVVEFWPNHYMALYHAGAARYALGEPVAARRHLAAFLEHYTAMDGWTRNAHRMLADLEGR